MWRICAIRQFLFCATDKLRLQDKPFRWFDKTNLSFHGAIMITLWPIWIVCCSVRRLEIRREMTRDAKVALRASELPANNRCLKSKATHYVDEFASFFD
ncbi:hypothetical protein M514_11884 [Trichuris suis]|uniref:Uncharacterized protein n=1 Tax=Trichuris suis TaxID=68888 RepID=A0A085N190_9BILA|nr:hypothetical protein M513_11884 [Trichuris suis]KFD63236.1 hypothetical protein M514_11884 [Trichuris suis]